MTDDVRTVAPQALDLLTRTVEGLSDGDLRRRSNLRDWTVRDLVAHVTSSVRKAVVLLEGGDVDSVPVDPAAFHAEDAAAAATALRAEADRVRELLREADLDAACRTPYGEMPLGRALPLVVVDAIVHSWDLERSVGSRLQLDEPLLAYASGVTDAMGEGREDNPHFDPPVEPAANATPTEQLMARLGRPTGMMAL